MEKEKPKLNKKKIGIIIFGFICLGLLIYNFNVPFPFRYEFKGTSEGYIYKIDRLTGKTWIVSQSGEKEVKKEAPPIERQEFPINLLVISEIKAENTGAGIKLSGTLENTSNLEATEILLRVDFFKEEKGKPFHYEVFYPFQTFGERVQPGSSKTFIKWANWQTYQAVSPYKNWLFNIYPKEAKVY